MGRSSLANFHHMRIAYSCIPFMPTIRLQSGGFDHRESDGVDVGKPLLEEVIIVI